MTRHRTPEEWEIAFDMWVNGVSAENIGKTIGVSHVAIMRAAKRFNWPERETRIVLKRALTLEERKRKLPKSAYTTTNAFTSSAIRRVLARYAAGGK